MENIPIISMVVDVANQIRAGMIEVGVGAGVESMSSQYGYVCFLHYIYEASMDDR